MKCPYCGGEVSSQSIACPYCGKANQEGIAFQEEIKRKIERNKLLKPFLIKQKTPELVQRMLTRILVLILVLNGVLFAGCIGLYVFSERDSGREPEPDSYAQQYLTEFYAEDSYYYRQFTGYRDDVMDALMEGEMPTHDQIEDLVNYAFYAVTYGGEETENETRQELTAFFTGYLGLSEEDCRFFDADELKDCDYTKQQDLKAQAVAAIEQKLKEADI
jgi:hypothetical protein